MDEAERNQLIEKIQNDQTSVAATLRRRLDPVVLDFLKSFSLQVVCSSLAQISDFETILEQSPEINYELQLRATAKMIIREDPGFFESLHPVAQMFLKSDNFFWIVQAIEYIQHLIECHPDGSSCQWVFQMRQMDQNERGVVV